MEHQHIKQTSISMKKLLKPPGTSNFFQVPCVLGDWMEWSGCTRPCGGGQQTQVRAITQEASGDAELSATQGPRGH